MNAPAVTIVIPAYRRIKYLREALPTALAQTFGDFEILISDDGASDEIAAYAASLGDPRVRYRRNERNLGIALNNAAAFAEARGRYLASLHDDDLWEPGFLAALVPALEADPEISVAFCDHHLIDEQGRLLPEDSEAMSRLYQRDRLAPGRHQPFLEQAVIAQSIPMVMSAVFRKSAWTGAPYPRRIGGSYDLWLAYLMVRQKQAVFYVPERLTRYRIHESSGTSIRGAHNLLDAVYVREQILRDPQLSTSGRRALRNITGVFYGKMALFYLEGPSFRRGRLLLRKAFSLLNRPRSMVALVVNAVRAMLRRILA